MSDEQEIKDQLDGLLAQLRKGEMLTKGQLKLANEIRTILMPKPYMEIGDLWHALLLVEGFQLRIISNTDLKQIGEQFDKLLRQVREGEVKDIDKNKEFENLSLMFMTFSEEDPDEYPRLSMIEAKIKDISRKNAQNEALESVLPKMHKNSS